MESQRNSFLVLELLYLMGFNYWIHKIKWAVFEIGVATDVSVFGRILHCYDHIHWNLISILFQFVKVWLLSC
jgi:hypothetical protein